MRNRKFFLYGLGWGIIGATLVMQLLMVAGKASDPARLGPADSGKTPAITDLQREAKEAGYELVRKDEKRITPEDLESAKRSAAEEALRKAGGQQPGRTVLIVTQQADAATIATALVQAGLISDRTVLIDELSKRGLTNKLQVGTYVFEGKPALDDIIAKITTPRP